MAFSARTGEGPGAAVWRQAEHLGTAHAFSTRLGGVSGGTLASLNLGENRGDLPENVRENWRRLCAGAGFHPDRLVFARQVHGRTVRAVTHADIHTLGEPVPYEADGLATDEPGLALCVFTADCVPVLLCDPVRRACAAVHAGWRGTAQDIAGEGVRVLREQFGCKSGNIRAAVGPCIGPCCFETGPEVPEAMLAQDPEAARCIRRSDADGKFLVDLPEMNRLLLVRAGVPPEQIELSGECTMCRHDVFWSHRYTRGARGAQAAVIML
jgi:YfiH family protein